MTTYMKDSNAPPLARFIPHKAGRALVVTAVKPPGRAVGNLAVTGKHPGRYTTSPGCHVAMFGDRLLFFISPDSSASAGPDDIGLVGKESSAGPDDIGLVGKELSAGPDDIGLVGTSGQI